MEADLALLKTRLDALEQKVVPEPESEPVAPVTPPPMPVAFEKKIEPPVVAPLPQEKSIFEEASVTPKQEPPSPPPVAPPLPMDRVEEQLGRVWLVRAGIVTLLTGLVFLGNMTYHAVIAPLGPGGKLALLFLSALLLGGVGWWLGRAHEGLKYLSRGLLAGGGALFYYSTYASHFVPALRVIESPLLAAVLLSLVALGFLGLAGRLGFQSAAIPTILLSYYVSSINPQGGAALFSNLLLALMALVLVRWRGWVGLSFASLSGTYLSFLHWRWVYGGGSLSVEAAYLAGYWVLFTLLVFLTRGGNFRHGMRAAFLTINNGAFFAIGSWALVKHFPAQYWVFPLAFGALLVLLALGSIRVAPRDKYLDGAFLSQGLLLIGVGLATKMSGYHFAITSAAMAAFYLGASTLWQRRVFLTFSLLSAIAAMLLALPESGSLGKIWPVVFLLLGCVVGRKFLCRGGKPLSVDLLTLAYATLGLALLGISIWQTVEVTQLALILSLTALLGTWLVRFHRLPEIALVLQFWLMVATGAWFFIPDPALWLTLLLIAVNVAVFHWWAGGAAQSFSPILRRFFQIVWVVGTTVLLQGWVAADGGAYELFWVPLLAVVFLGYGLWEKARPFAWASLWFGAQAVFLCVESLFSSAGWRAGEVWCLILLGAYTGLQVVAQRFPSIQGQAFLYLRRAFTFSTALLFVAFANFHLEFGWELVAQTSAAIIVFAIAGWRKKIEVLGYGVVLFLIALGVDILEGSGFTPLPGWIFLGLLPVLYASLFFVRHRLAEATPIPRQAFTVGMILSLLIFWWHASRLAHLHGQGQALTLVWVASAVAVLLIGVLFRDRATRLAGLAIFAACLGRIYCVDVWRVNDFLRYVSFIILGIVLLAFGWLYGRFADWLKKIL